MKIADGLKKLVASVAPTLGQALMGPYGGIAGQFLADKLTGGDTSKVEAVLANANPQQMLELKKLDQEFALAMEKLDIDVFKLDVDDRKSAREMTKTSGAMPQVVLSIVYTIGFFALIFALGTGTLQIAPDVKDLWTMLIGVLTGAQVQILNFWFGSSRGSAQKSEQLSRLTVKN